MTNQKADDLWLILPHLGPGGAQKVAMLAANYFLKKGWRIRVVTLLPGPGQVHQVPDGVLFTDLGPAVKALWQRDHWNQSLIARGRRFLAPKRRAHRLASRLLMGPLMVLFNSVSPLCDNWCSRLLRWCVNGIDGPPSWLLRDLLLKEQPVRVVSFLTRTNVRVCSALWTKSCHLVISERNDISRQQLPFPWNRFRNVLYRRADVLTANTTGVMESIASIFPDRHIAMLPNPLPSRPITTDGSQTWERHGLLTVARLVPQKGIDILIDSLDLTNVDMAHWPLTLVGDGPERQALEKRVRDSGLQERVRFMGFRSDVQTFYQKAGIFVLPSRFEGMPNALIEAMAAGLAVVVTDASPGPLEVVVNGITGLVVKNEDPKALALALDRLAGDPDLRRSLGEAAKAHLKKMDWPVVGPIWESLLNKS